LSEENKAIVRHFVKLAQGSGPEASMAAIDEYIAPDFKDHSAVGVPPTREGVKMTFGALWAGMPDMKCTIHEQIAEGDKVVTRKTLSGTNTGDLFGVPATGKHIDLQVIDILRIKDGKLVEHWNIVDQMGLMQQLGVIPAN
jgi:steroid delta-isomerase-like uncharacterized protein